MNQLAITKPVNFSDEFLQGQRDCKDGKPHQDRGDAYNNGYAAQYEAEQMLTAMGLRRDK